MHVEIWLPECLAANSAIEIYDCHILRLVKSKKTTFLEINKKILTKTYRQQPHREECAQFEWKENTVFIRKTIDDCFATSVLVKSKTYMAGFGENILKYSDDTDVVVSHSRNIYV